MGRTKGEPQNRRRTLAESAGSPSTLARRETAETGWLHLCGGETGLEDRSPTLTLCGMVPRLAHINHNIINWIFFWSKLVNLNQCNILTVG